MKIFGLPLFPVVLLVAGVIDLMIALGFHLFVAHFRKKGNVIRRKWRPVPVKILSSRLIETQGDESTLYSPEIRYEYTVDGTRYESDRISIFPKWSSSQREHHRKVVAEFPRGRECSGWVNPWNLKESVLTAEGAPPQATRVIQFILVGTGVATLVASAVFWMTGAGSPG